MNVFIQISVIAIISLFILQTFRLIYPIRKKVTCATGMMATMIISSMAGLIVGTILPLSQNYTMSSILAMIIGIGAGVIIGILFNTMTILEGIMGGIMGGLMGAMMGEMLPVQSIYIVTIVLLVVLLITLLLLKKTIKEEAGIVHITEPTGVQIKSLSIIISCVTVAMFMMIMFGFSFNTDKSLKTDHMHHHKAE
ncbi:hypothetical protein [Halalkalibacter krulwichiae]|uniref:Uncharacterized protein n=1 Tax=Halalkalibacter krulwichiae TaxID=199441 RepID=A0A1X9MI17_9BACI|nr:hypothetical protein [Halalkalibacter krulwichiae]ARK30192.1 hypothetical protein BkAM31D_10330 [Halalkalibacter krulwichiae]